MKSGLLERIQSKGHWRVNFQPLDAEERQLALSECQQLIEGNRVELRGWDYPHFPARNDAQSAIERHNHFIEGWCDWQNHIEMWRIYQSQQFLHYLALREDWIDLDAWYTRSNPNRPSNPLNVTGTIYTITEIFELCRRLLTVGLFQRGVRMSISLRNTAGKSLHIDEPRRVPFSSARTTSANEISFERTVGPEELQSGSTHLAAECIIYIFERFGWNVAPSQIESQQETFLKGLT